MKPKTNIKEKKHFKSNLAFRIWICFIVFIIAVFFLTWFFLITFLGSFYESIKFADIKKATARMSEIYNEGDDGYVDRFRQIAINNDMCVLMLNAYGVEIYRDEYILGKSCEIHSLGPRLFKYKSELVDMVNFSPTKGVLNTKIYNENTNTEILLYGIQVNDNAYLFINTPLAPVAKTVSIIQRQLFIITDILIILGLIISLMTAGVIAKPITRITNTAKKLAKGNYNIHFSESSYYEANELADILNYATTQISKVDTQQRDLIANVSHDLRTPLTMLRGYAEMIRDLSGDNPEKRNQHLQIIIDETDRLAALVSDMLDISKLENDGITLNITEFDINSLLINICEKYKSLGDNYHINYQPLQETLISCDMGKIQQVILNLINNAFNYTGADGQVYVSLIKEDNGVKIEVRDTGKGITKEEMELIFDKYYRSENHKRTTIGTGLGLSIVKSILKKHGFPFGVKSTIGVGTTFWFMITNNK